MKKNNFKEGMKFGFGFLLVFGIIGFAMAGIVFNDLEYGLDDIGQKYSVPYIYPEELRQLLNSSNAVIQFEENSNIPETIVWFDEQNIQTKTVKKKVEAFHFQWLFNHYMSEKIVSGYDKQSKFCLRDRWNNNNIYEVYINDSNIVRELNGDCANG